MTFWTNNSHTRNMTVKLCTIYGSLDRCTAFHQMDSKLYLQVLGLQGSWHWILGIYNLGKFILRHLVAAKQTKHYHPELYQISYWPATKYHIKANFGPSNDGPEWAARTMDYCYWFIYVLLVYSHTISQDKQPRGSSSNFPRSPRTAISHTESRRKQR